MDNHEISERVRQQYERYPYPDISPDTDRPQMLVSGHLELMCQVVWGGRKKPQGLRVLDAGCGTGSPLVAMARAYPGADIVGVDFSEASLKKARRLAERFDVKNARFYHLPIQRLTELGETFDFVISSGVLHHLPEPALGLKAIGEVLAPQGVVSMMLYGKYGRIGINMLQEALGNIFSADEPMEDRIKMAMELARVVPANHPMAQRRKGRELQEGKDSGIVDLLLHANDIPFDVPLIYRMCRDAGMRFYRWLFPQIYKPENYFKGPVLNGALDGLQVHEKHEIAELVHGCNGKHSFFAVGPDFNAPDTGLSNGNWRNLHACLTPCLSWNRTMPAPGKKDCFIIPPAVVQDAWDPLVLKKWELLFLGQVVPEKSLGKLAWEPAIRKLMPFNSRKTADLAVEELLEKVLDQMGIVLLEQ